MVETKNEPEPLSAEEDNAPLFPFSIPNKKVLLKTRPKLVILEHPSRQHRARYESEGSRGAVKDASQDGSPKIQLLGYNESSVDVYIFVCNDKGSPKPHLYFSACKIASRTSTPCDETELTIEGIRTRAIKITLYPKDNMIGTVDCVGILKMRNADVENKYKQQLNKNMTRKKNNSIVRMAFRATIPEFCGDETFHIEVLSTTIQCSQPEGQPEILDLSTSHGSPEGDEKLILIGKNLNKNCEILFSAENWTAAARANSEFPSSKDHLVVWTPRYIDSQIQYDVQVEVRIKHGGKLLEPYSKPFTYKANTPNNVLGLIQEQIQKGLQLNLNRSSLLQLEKIMTLAKHNSLGNSSFQDDDFQDQMEVKSGSSSLTPKRERDLSSQFSPIPTIGSESGASRADFSPIESQMSSQLSSPRTGMSGSIHIQSSPIDFNKPQPHPDIAELQDTQDTPTNDVLPEPNQFYPQPTGFVLADHYNDHSFSSQSQEQPQGVIDPMRDPTSPSDAIASSLTEIHFQPEDLDQHSYTSQDFQQQPSSNSLFNPSLQVQQQQHHQVQQSPAPQTTQQTLSTDESCHNSAYAKHKVNLLPEEDVYNSLQTSCSSLKEESKEPFSNVPFLDNDLMQMKDIKPLQQNNTQQEISFCVSDNQPSNPQSFSQMPTSWTTQPHEREPNMVDREPEIQQVQVLTQPSSNVTSQMEIQQHTEIASNQDVPWSSAVQVVSSNELPIQLPVAAENSMPQQLAVAESSQFSSVSVSENQYGVTASQTDTNNWSKTTAQALPETDVVMVNHLTNTDTIQERTISMTGDEIQRAISNGTAVIVEASYSENTHHQSDQPLGVWNNAASVISQTSDQFDSMFQQSTPHNTKPEEF
ncbi:unnamed protein product [Oikopleura dioica]|uniref:RHD domain-containing protein n=1 Tax=Oikopleura dioica TaxID=34765 RepID=E4XJB9_OIKDI|nr:unnamed protein product [Oikopleura dioica]